jgi:glycosyltransferase involved in cell wall biosynthesis
MRHLMPLTVSRAALVLCGTQSARADIVRHLHAAPRKIRVTPYAVEPRFYQPVSPQAIAAMRAKYDLGDAPYLLSVGVLQPRKNLPRLMKAFEQLQQRHPDWTHRLVIAGKKGWGEDAQQQNPKSKIRFIGYVDDEELPALYAGAELFAYPSLYEGFGLPIIEAMASGCAVLTSDYGAMAEVAADAAQQADPRSIESITRGLEAVLEGSALKINLVQKGHRRARECSIRQQATATLDVYGEVLRCKR